MHVNFEQVPQNIWNDQEFTFHFVDLKFSYISYWSLLASISLLGVYKRCILPLSNIHISESMIFGCIQIQCSLCLVWKVLQIVPRTQSCEFHQKVWSNKFLLMILVPGLQCFAFQKLFAGGLKLLRKSSNKYKILLRNSLMPPFKANQIHVAGEASQQK